MLLIGKFCILARKVSISAVIFLLGVEVAGAALLAFFGISLPVVQVAGGLGLAAMGWQLLNAGNGDAARVAAGVTYSRLVEEYIFYPLTLPFSVGPGCMVVTLALSADAWGRGFA